MADPSPAAQAVLDAYKKGGLDVALRAVADQVVPEQRPWHRTDGEPFARHNVRCKLLALATELENHQ